MYLPFPTAIDRANSCHRYKGVVGKLAEREERNEEQQKQLDEADRLATKQVDEIGTLRDMVDELRDTITKVKQESQVLEEGYIQDFDNLEQDRDERLNLMVEELNQEHEYRTVAEREISAKDRAYTELQIKFQKTKEELDEQKEFFNMLTEECNEYIEKLETLEKELEEEKGEKKDLEEKVKDLEAKAGDLEDDISTLVDRLEQSNQKIEEQDKALETGELNTKAKETEINQLRSDVFGAQEELKYKNGVVTKLEGDIKELNQSMENLQAEKDAVIDEKNGELDELEGQLDQAAQDIKEKDEDIAALRKENLTVIAQCDELRKALAIRGKENRALKEINVNLLTDAEQDIAAQRNWAARKEAMVKDVRQQIEVVSAQAAGAGTTTLTQQVKKTTITKTVRDSGFHDEDEMSEDELLMANGEVQH
jgi:chromosome segregation ATPase